MLHFVSVERFRALVQDAHNASLLRAEKGRLLSADYSGDCAAPRHINIQSQVTTTIWAQLTATAEFGKVIAKWGEYLIPSVNIFANPSILSTDYLMLALRVRCKKCEPCKKARRHRWAVKAMIEIGKSERTWFCTYTFGFRSRLELQTSKEPEKLVTRWHQLYNKSLRKELSKAAKPMRFLRVMEHHKDGTLHAHSLVHDLQGFITKRALQRHWHRGFSTVKLGNKQHAFYISKYIGKEMTGRIASSQFYGEPSLPDVSIHDQWIRDITGQD